MAQAVATLTDGCSSLSDRRGWSRVLVIDDDRDVGRLVRLILEQDGYEVGLRDDGFLGPVMSRSSC